MNSVEILFLGGVFAPENEAEVLTHTKKGVEFSANQMQIKIISALRELVPTHVLSAPFIGHYPNQSDWAYFRGFSEVQTLCEYVSFNNLWGYRNISRTAALIRKMQPFLERKDSRKLIVVFCTHDPFLAAAAHAKRKDPDIRICLIAPDLPQYMNLEANRSWFYDFCKQFDIRAIQNHIRTVDASIVLTEDIAASLQLNDRPYAVVEGIVDRLPEITPTERAADGTMNIVYAGKLYERFGVRTLVEAFRAIQDPRCRLILCGNGDAVAFIRDAAHSDPRIQYAGQVSPREVQAYLRRAAVLVNPRPNNEAYTRFSFPSKDIEYLLQGKPVVAFMLDGMPACYRDFLYEIQPTNDPVKALKTALEDAMFAPQEEIWRKYLAYREYASRNLMASEVARKILQISFSQGMK